MAILLVHKPYSHSASERFHMPLKNNQGRSAPGLHPFPLHFIIYIDDLQDEIEKDIFVSAYADDLSIACGGRNKDMIVVSLQPEVDRVVASSDNARLIPNTS